MIWSLPSFVDTVEFKLAIEKSGGNGRGREFRLEGSERM
jgi:hypothetical protein